MKKIITTLFFSLGCFLSQAQISFLFADIPSNTWTNAEQKDTSTGAVNWGSKGANQTYDFSRFHNRALDSVFYSTPTSAQTSAVPGCNLAITTDHNTYILAKSATTLFDYVGGQTIYNGNTILSNFNPVDTGYKLPTTYGQNFRGTYGFQTTVPGSAVGQPSVYQVRLTNTTTYTDTIDGWGTVITPTGTYKCLREHRIEHSSTLLEYQLFSFSPWANVPTSSSLPNNPVVSTTNNYNYLTKETHGTAISFTYDSANNPLTASWSTTPPYPIAKFGYTNGTAGLVNFLDSSISHLTSYSWNFGDGTANSSGISPNHSYTANGTYYVCLTVTNASGSNTYCDSVHVTNIPNTPLPPKAIKDTASVTQPGSVSINVLANDINYNASDTVCVTGVWGTPAGWETVQGCTQVLFHPLNSSFTGLDTFYYRSCDTRLTTLCDTGMVVVNVLPAPVPPIASFTATHNGCLGGTFVNHSLNADSLFWSFSQIGATGTPFDTTIINANLIGVPSTTTSFSLGKFSICLTAKNAHGTSQICDTFTFSCSGINEISASDYRIYPNPASEMIQLDLSRIDPTTMKGLTDIVIYNMLGEKLKTMSIDQTSISVKDLSNGVYMIAVMDKDQNRKILNKFEVMR